MKIVAAGALAAALTASAAGSAAALAPVTPAHHTIYVLSAGGGHHVRPRFLYIHKNPGGAHGYWLSRLRWGVWNERSASGQGDNLYSADRVTVSLSRAVRKSGRWIFTRMTIHSPAANHLGWTTHHLWWSARQSDWEYH